MQVLTFDFHNTLVHCDPWFDLEIRSLPRAVARRLDLGRDLDDDLIDQTYRALRKSVIASGKEIDAVNGVAIVFDRLGIAASRDALESTVDALMRDAQESVIAVDGAVQTVDDLHRHGVKLGIVSSAVHHETLNWSLDRIGIAGHFASIVTSASSGHYKSTTAIYEHALAALGGSARHSVHLGDSLRWDVTISGEAGMKPVWLQTNHRESFSEGLPTSKPVLTLQSLEGAGPILLDLLASIGVGAGDD